MYICCRESSSSLFLSSRVFPSSAAKWRSRNWERDWRGQRKKSWGRKQSDGWRKTAGIRVNKEYVRRNWWKSKNNRARIERRRRTTQTADIQFRLPTVMINVALCSILSKVMTGSGPEWSKGPSRCACQLKYRERRAGRTGGQYVSPQRVSLQVLLSLLTEYEGQRSWLFEETHLLWD